MKSHYFSAAELGKAFRANRKSLQRSQQWVANKVGCRRQTIVDLEAGKNVRLYTVMAALASLGKGLEIVDSRVDLDHLKELFHEED